MIRTSGYIRSLCVDIISVGWSVGRLLATWKQRNQCDSPPAPSSTTSIWTLPHPCVSNGCTKARYTLAHIWIWCCCYYSSVAFIVFIVIYEPHGTMWWKWIFGLLLVGAVAKGDYTSSIVPPGLLPWCSRSLIVKTKALLVLRGFILRLVVYIFFYFFFFYSAMRSARRAKGKHSHHYKYAKPLRKMRSMVWNGIRFNHLRN